MNKRAVLVKLSVLVVAVLVETTIVLTWQSANDTYNRTCIYTLNPVQNCNAQLQTVTSLDVGVALGLVAVLVCAYVVGSSLFKTGPVMDQETLVGVRGRWR